MKVGDLFAQMQIDFSTFSKDERLAKQRTQTLSASLSSILKNAFSFGIGMGFFQAVQRGFRATIGSAVSFNDTLEQATIGFTTMLGSAKRADYFLSRLADFAAHTPFEFEGLLDASKRMMALGFAADDVIPTMTAIGDAAAALGSGQQGIDSLITGLGNIKTQGRVTSIAMMQLARAGVPAWDILAESVGKTTGETRKLVEQGLISADQGIAALVAGMEKRFPGMMSKMEDSWRGVTATVKDVWSMTLGEMTKGLFSNATEWLKGIRDTMQGFYDALKAGGLQYAIQQTFGAGVAASVGTLVSALKGLWNMVTGVAGVIVRNWTLIRNLTLGVVWAFASLKIAAFAVGAAAKATTVLTFVMTLLKGEAIKTSLTTGFLARVIQTYNLQLHLASMAGIAHVGVLQVLKTAIYSVTAALGTLLWPLIIIGSVLGIGVTAWSKYNAAVQKAAQQAQAAKMAEQQKAYAESVNQAAKGTDTQAEALANLGKVTGKNLQSFDEFHELTKDTAGTDFGDLLSGEGSAAPGMPEFDMPDLDLVFDFDDAIAQAKADMGGFWGWCKQGFINTWNTIGDYLGQKWQAIAEFTRPVWEPIGEFFTNLWEGVKAITGIVWDVISPYLTAIWDGIVTTAVTIWSTLGPFFSGLWNSVKVVGETIWGLIQFFLATIWFSIVEIAKATWSVLEPFFTFLWDVISAVAMAAWNFLKSTLIPLWDGFVAAAQTIWAALKPFFDILWGAVKWIFETVWKPLAAWLESVWNAIKAVAETVWALIQKVIVDPVNAANKVVTGIVETLRKTVAATWDKILASIKAVKDFIYKYAIEPFQKAKDFIFGIVNEAKDWGKNLISNITDGIKSKANAIKDAVSGVVGKVKDFLGFSSPTKEGPGRYADEWAPNLMKMYSEGILSNVNKVQSAAGAVAQSLAPMTAQPVMDLSVSSSFLKDSILEALMQKEIVVGGAGGQELSITLKLENGEVLADLLIDPINRTAKSRGYAPVFKPAN